MTLGKGNKMPDLPSFPGVHVEEVPSTGHVVTGLPTANAAFVDVFERGPDNVPTPVTTFGEFRATFGNLGRHSRASYGIHQFFLHGGSMAWVIRVPGEKATVARGTTALGPVHAVGSGRWGNNIEVATEQDGVAFNLVVRERLPAEGRLPERLGGVEIHRNLSPVPTDSNSWSNTLNQQSSLINAPRATVTPPTARVPGAPGKVSDSITSPQNSTDLAGSRFRSLSGGTDDFTIGPADLGREGDGDTIPATGYHTLDRIAPDVFNTLCLPVMAAFSEDEWATAFFPAKDYCEKQRAFFIVDPPAGNLVGDAAEQAGWIQRWFEGVGGGGAVSHQTAFGAVYFPRIRITDPDPAAKSVPMETETSGTMAGVYAATDASRGVWAAPAGTAAVIEVLGPAVEVDDAINGVLNELGINVIRKFPVYGTVSWGARTINGADQIDDTFQYIGVRRLANFIETSLQQSTRWAVFEPNDEPLWAGLRSSVGAFMDGLFRQGAFASAGRATDAYFVQCDPTTTTALDQAQGRVNVLVGFAPVRPAEFVVITISQATSLDDVAGRHP